VRRSQSQRSRRQNSVAIESRSDQVFGHLSEDEHTEQESLKLLLKLPRYWFEDLLEELIETNQHGDSPTKLRNLGEYCFQ
jgi:hypothetical protein